MFLKGFVYDDTHGLYVTLAESHVILIYGKFKQKPRRYKNEMQAYFTGLFALRISSAYVQEGLNGRYQMERINK